MLKRLKFLFSLFLIFNFFVSHSFLMAKDNTLSLIQASSSLIFYLNEKMAELDPSTQEIKKDIPGIVFEDHEVKLLWDRILIDIPEGIYSKNTSRLASKAFDSYCKALNLLSENKTTEARSLLANAKKSISSFWSKINTQNNHLFSNQIDSTGVEKKTNKTSSSFENNPLLSKSAKRQIRPYLLPRKHEAKRVLDHIFSKSRAIQDANTFANAGFITHFIQKRSFIRVASHPSLPGYLMKVYLDNELRLKRNLPGWHWFVKRCEGVAKIQKVIQKNKIRNFATPKKWIYPIPIHGVFANDPKYVRKEVILLVEDMRLVSKTANLHAWKHSITREHLKELYKIISQGSGSSYRADNIPYTKNGKFAFIDTEYPGKKHDYNSIRSYLSSEMRAEWDKIVKKGK
jgi:hypothetical protein